MKRTVIVALIAVAVLLAGAPVLKAQEAGPEALIGRARAVTLSPHFSREEITQALVGVLDAALLVLPATSYEAEFRGRIETVRKMFDEGGLLEDKIRQYLGLAYKLASGGQAWTVPAELASAYREADIIDRAKKICVALLDRALAGIEAGRREEAVRDLVAFVLFVVTPVEA
ncbi:MAG: hypothetical protein GX465_13575 [Acidobacteria bacterium]|nr:hypothetical protein [Acidobacteriota bacterium]